MLELFQLLQKLFLLLLEISAASVEVVSTKQLFVASVGAAVGIFWLSFLSWKKYMLSPYIILVCNRLVG